MSWISASPAARVGFLPALLAAGVAAADDVPPPADNIVPIEVRQVRNGHFNLLLVDVTVCDAAQHCRTVPNVQVDTAAIGLRLYREALDGLELDAVTDAAGRPLAHWGRFAMGDLWGTLHRAHVRVGNVATTRAIPIQLYDWPSDQERLPPAYAAHDARERSIYMGNGILGIAPGRYWPERYYAFNAPASQASASDWERVVSDESRQLTNPIAHFPAPYDNGSVIRLPDVDWKDGQEKAQGWLGLGIGPPTEALFPAGARVISHALDASHRFPMAIGKGSFDVVVDSGTNALLIDLDDLGVAHDPARPSYYHADELTPLPLRVTVDGKEVELKRPLYLGPCENWKKSLEGYGVLPTIAARLSRPDAHTLLGVPFFYGRTVATGLHGTVNPFAPACSSPYGFIGYTD